MKALEFISRPHIWAIALLTFAALALFVGSFFVPPLGVIDGTVLKAASILLGFAIVWVIAHVVDKDERNIKFSHGDTSLELNKDQ